MKVPHAIQGCTFCNHVTENVNGYRKFTIPEISPITKTGQAIKGSMLKEKVTQEDTMNGIKKPLFPMGLKKFDFVHCKRFHAFYIINNIRDYINLFLTDTDAEYYKGSPTNL